MSTPLGHDRGIRRTIATVCLSGMLEDKLDAVAGAGFDGVEIFENDLIASSSTPAGVTQSSTHGLRGRWRLIRDGV
jgi:4-hydroxyphenylpyruvate dioxygenase